MIYRRKKSASGDGANWLRTKLVDERERRILAYQAIKWLRMRVKLLEDEVVEAYHLGLEEGRDL